MRRVATTMNLYGKALNDQTRGQHESTNTIVFNNLQDAGGPRKTL